MTTPREFAARLLRSSGRAYASAAVERLRQRHADLLDAGLPAEFADPVADTHVRILHLAESVAVDRPALLSHAFAWYKVALHHRGVADAYLPANVDAIAAVLVDELPSEASAIVARHLQTARRELAGAPTDAPSSLSKDLPHGELAARFLLAALEGRGDDAIDLLRAAVRDGVAVADLHDHVLAPVQRESGRMWLTGEITIADEHYGSALVDRALWLLQEHVPRPAADAPRVLTMGVGGNLHEIGLRMVAQRLQLAGFQVHHLGGNTPFDALDQVLLDQNVDLLAVAATMTLHLGTLARTIAHLRAAGPARQRPILVGGEPFRVVPDLHEVLGADASAADAALAVAAAKRLLGAAG